MRSHIHAVAGELREFDLQRFAENVRPGLRAECLKDPRAVWNGALNYTLEVSTKGEAHARRWAAGIWYGIYPGQKMPFGWFDMRPTTPTPETYSLAEREVRRFRKNNKPSKRKAA